MMSFTPESDISLIILRLRVSDVTKIEIDWNYHLQMLLLSPCKVKHLLGILQQNCSFGLCLGDIQWTCEDTDFGPGKLLDHS